MKEKSKTYHFMGKWKNGDPLVICSYGKNKKDAFINMLTARKNGKFKFKKGDNFSMEYKCEEEHPFKLFKHGHTQWIVDEDGNVTMN